MMRLAIIIPLALCACTPGKPAFQTTPPPTAASPSTRDSEPGGGSTQDSVLFTERDPLFTASKNLVNWWPANNHSLDLAGHRHATLERPVTYMTGHAGKAFTFNYGAYVDCGPANPALPENNFTFMFWYLAECQESWQYLAWSADKNGLAIALNTSDERLIVTASPGEFATPSESQPCLAIKAGFDNFWHHLAVSFDGHTFRLYIDGVLTASSPCDACIPGNHRLLLASTARAGDESFFKGRLQDITLFSRPLRDAEIKSIYHAQSTTPAASQLTGTELAKFRECLLGVSHVPAWYAVQRLPAAGESALQLLSQSILPDNSTIQTLIADFDSDSWRIRENAMIQLRAYGRSIRPILLAMKDRQLSPEADIRLIELLYTMKSGIVTGDDEYHARIAQCLVRIDSAQARRLAKSLPAPPKYTRPPEPPAYFEASEMEVERILDQRVMDANRRW